MATTMTRNGALKSKLTVNSTTVSAKRKRSTRSEIDRLLSDEGTLNMLNSINNLVPVDQNQKGNGADNHHIQKGGGVNLVVTPFRNMRGLNYKKKLLSKNGPSSAALELSKESKIIRRRSSDNSAMNSTAESRRRHTNSLSALGAQGSPMFVKRRSSLLSTLIIKEEDSNGIHKGSTGNSNAKPKGVMLNRKGISEESRLAGAGQRSFETQSQSSRNLNSYDNEVIPESNVNSTRTVLCHRTDDGTVGHVTLSYKASNHTFTLTPAALDELSATLTELNNDKAIKLIIVSSTGRGIFCAGFDTSCLISNDLMKRKAIAEGVGKRIRHLFNTLSKLNKVCIASVNGDAEGLGVTMLPLFDLVYASDKCTFKIVPEYSQGLSVFNSEYVRHNKIISSMVYAGKRLTAQEAMDAGLITEILWPAKYHEELFLRIRNILKAHRNAQTMESVKRILTKGQTSAALAATGHPTSTANNAACLLRNGIETESRSLIESWISNKFQETFKKALVSKSIKP